MTPRSVPLPSIAVVLLAVPLHAAELCVVAAGTGMSTTTDCGGVETGIGTIGFSTDPDPCTTGGGASICEVEPRGDVSFVWTISSSALDPRANTGSIGPGATDLYLWFFCSASPSGMETAEFGLAGDLTVVSFAPQNGFLNSPVPVEAGTWGRMKGRYR